MHIKFFDRGENFRGFALIENVVQVAVAYGIQHQSVLITQDLFFLLIGKATARELFSVRRRSLPDTASAHEHLGLQ